MTIPLLLAFWRTWIRPVLVLGITLPLWVILAAIVWWQVDKGSAVKAAVESAIEELVDGAELEAERASNEALRKILAERNRVAERDREALARYADLLAASENEKGDLIDELAELEAMPPPDGCTVDDALLDRLRN
ncbi:MAG: hypothetical protein KGZ68_11945 [Dechloromonas sp.]|nr:hypothetical protein [Dechloromonas sp.]